MTRNTTNVIVGPYTPNGVTTTFPFDFEASTTDEVGVLLDGEEIDTSLFSVTLNDDGTGQVVFFTAPTGSALYPFLNPTFDQPTTLRNQGPFFQRTIEQMIDREASKTLWLRERVKLLFSTAMLTVSQRAGRFQSWDADGNPYLSTGTGSDPALRSDLSGTSGAGIVGWLASRASAVARSIADFFTDTHSIMDYLPSVTRSAVRAGTQTANLDSYVETALANIPLGGRLRFPAGRFPLFRVDVPYGYVAIVAEKATTFVRQAVSAVNNGIGADGLDRAMFIVDGKDGVTFDLNGATVDLGGEGPLNIGGGGFANLYLVTPVPGTYGLAGPANAFIYARGSNKGKVRGPFTIKNTGENAILLVNCGDWEIDGQGGDITNIANYGVEMLYNTAAGGMQASALLGNNVVRGVRFSDINDFSLGALNGVAVGGGAGGNQVIGPDTYAENLGYIRGDRVYGCSFTRCVRDVQFEVPYGPAPGETGTVLLGGAIVGNHSVNAGQLSIALIGCEQWTVDEHVAINPSAAPVPMLGPSWPSSAGIYISSRCRGTTVGAGCRVIETHTVKSQKLTDGIVLTGNKARITSATMAATSAYIGERIGIKGIGPSGGLVHHEATITAVPNANTIDFSPAAPSFGAALTFAFGRACREGIVSLEGDSSLIHGLVMAGTASGVAGEPAASGIRVKDASAAIRIEAQVKAPATGGTFPTGITIDGADGVKIRRVPTGFTNAFAVSNAPIDLKLPSELTGVAWDNSQSWGETFTMTFQLDNVPTSAAGVNLLRGNSPAGDKALLPCPARVVAQNVVLSAAPTGAFTFFITMGGAGQNAINVTETEISGGFRWGGKDRASYDAPVFAKGTIMESKVNTSGTWVNTVDAFVEYTFDRGSR